MIDMGKLLGPVHGTQRRSDKARAARAAKRAQHQYSPNYTQRGGYRYLTDRELDQWYARLEQCLAKKVKVPRDAMLRRQSHLDWLANKK